LVLAVMTMVVGIGVPITSAGADPTSTTTQPSSDAVSVVHDDESDITSLEKTVDHWNDGCNTTDDLDQDLNYANDALAQGDPTGARLFLDMAKDDAQDGDAGYLPGGDLKTLDDQSTSVFNAIPTEDPSTPAVTATPDLPSDTACSAVSSYDPSAVDHAAAAITANIPAVETADSRSIDSGVTLTGFTANGSADLTADASATADACQEPGVDDTADTLRKIGLAAVGMVGDKVTEVGGLVGAIADVLWPDNKPDLWAAMTQCVDQKVNQAVDSVVQNGIDTTLSGMKSAIGLYSTVLTNKKNSDGTWPANVQQNIVAQYHATLTTLVNDLPVFQPSVRPYLYLPEYVEAMTLVMGMLRDGIIDGQSFGLDPASINQYKLDLAGDITNGTAYVNKEITDYQNVVQTSTNSTYSSTENYDSVALLDQALLPATVDQTFYWPYLDPIKYPNPVHPANTRVTYTVAYGFIDKNKPVTLDQAGAGAGVDPITHVDMWGTTRLYALKVAYGSNPASKLGAPGGVETTPQGIGFSVEPTPNSFGPIDEVSGYYDPHAVPIDLDFFWTKSAKYAAGSTGMLGDQGAPKGQPYADVSLHYQKFDAKFPNMILDYAKVEGISSGYQSANCVVFGFRYADSFNPPVT
jgi:hypothetical protein